MKNGTRKFYILMVALLHYAQRIETWIHFMNHTMLNFVLHLDND
jgi:hypothetical protein